MSLGCCERALGLQGLQEVLARPKWAAPLLLGPAGCRVWVRCARAWYIVASQCVDVFDAAADVPRERAGSLFRRSCPLFGPGLTWPGAERCARPGCIARALCSRTPVRQAACRG